MQGTSKNPTCCGASRPMRRNCQALMPRACAPQQEKPPHWEAWPPQRRIVPPLAAAGKSPSIAMKAQHNQNLKKKKKIPIKKKNAPVLQDSASCSLLKLHCARRIFLRSRSAFVTLLLKTPQQLLLFLNKTSRSQQGSWGSAQTACSGLPSRFLHHIALSFFDSFTLFSTCLLNCTLCHRQHILTAWDVLPLLCLANITWAQWKHQCLQKSWQPGQNTLWQTINLWPSLRW